MRVAQLSRSASRLNGGIFYANADLFRALVPFRGDALEMAVFGGRDEFTEKDSTHLAPWPCHTKQIFGPSGYAFCPGLNASLRAFAGDLLHLHGLWAYATWQAGKFGTQRNKAVLVSPHGMMNAWALKHSSLKKRLIASLYERRVLLRATAFHALTQAEAAEIREFGYTGPIAVIPNGVAIPDQHLVQWPSGGPRKLLYLGRLHPKKGLRELIRAWKRSAASRGDWELCIAGWDEIGFGAALRQEAEGCTSIRFLGPLWGDAKQQAIQASQAMILPSHSEGLPMTVLEAWSYGRPALITKACNLPEGFAAGAAMEIKHDDHGIAAALDKLADMDEAKLVAMGEKGRLLVERNFSQTSVAGAMFSLYQSLGSGTGVPGSLNSQGSSSP